MLADSQDGRWVSRAEAQMVLGISSATLDRRLREGRLEKRALADGTVLVHVPSANGSEPAQLGVSVVSQVHALVSQGVALQQANRALRKENAELKARVAELEAARGERVPTSLDLEMLRQG